MTTSNYYAAADGELRRQRRSMGDESPEKFAKIYLAHHCRLPFSRMHREVFAALAEMGHKPGGRLAIAAAKKVRSRARWVSPPPLPSPPSRARYQTARLATTTRRRFWSQRILVSNAPHDGTAFRWYLHGVRDRSL